jgi:hypothetical protein
MDGRGPFSTRNWEEGFLAMRYLVTQEMVCIEDDVLGLDMNG